jgi:hypothetical protein
MIGVAESCSPTCHRDGWPIPAKADTGPTSRAPKHTPTAPKQDDNFICAPRFSDLGDHRFKNATRRLVHWQLVHWQFKREDIPVTAHFGDATPRYQNKRIKCIFIVQR